MIIVGAFQHNIELEQALAVLEQSGILQNEIMVIAMDNEPQSPNQHMSKTNHSSSKGVEVGFACATGFSVIGASVGFILLWGPIICGLIAAFIGFGIGYGVYYARNMRKNIKHRPKIMPDIIVIVQCKEEQASQVREIMWTYQALTVGATPEGNNN